MSLVHALHESLAQAALIQLVSAPASIVGRLESPLPALVAAGMRAHHQVEGTSCDQVFSDVFSQHVFVAAERAMHSLHGTECGKVLNGCLSGNPATTAEGAINLLRWIVCAGVFKDIVSGHVEVEAEEELVHGFYLANIIVYLPMHALHDCQTMVASEARVVANSSVQCEVSPLRP